MPTKPPEIDDWETVDDWEDVSDEKPATKEKPNWMADTWAAANKPLTDAPSKFAKSVSESMGEATPEDWNIPFTGGMKWKGLGQGMLQGAGDVASGFTSPLNLATTAATMGSGTLAKQGFGTAARGLGAVGRALSAPTAVHGGMQVLNPETSLSEKGFGLAELAGGAAGMKYHAPVMSTSGPQSGLAKVGASVTEIAPESIAKGDIFKTGTPEPIGTHASQEGAINAALETQKGTPLGKPSSYTIKRPTKELVQKLRDAGYESAGISKEGYPIMRLKPEIVESAPELNESVTQGPEETSVMNDEQGIQSNTEVPPESVPVQGIDSDKFVPATFEESLTGKLPLRHEPLPSESAHLTQTPEQFQAKLDNIELPESFQKFTEPLTPEQTQFPKSKVFHGPGDEAGINAELARLQAAKGKSPQQQLNEEALAARRQPGNTGMANEEGPRQTATQSNPPSQQEIPSQISKITKQVDTAKMAPPEQKQSMLRNALDANRTLLTAYDLSAPGRQGLPLIGRKEYWTSIDDMFRAWGSEKAYNLIQDSIKEHPSGYFKEGRLDLETGNPKDAGKTTPSYAQKVGLDLTDLVKNKEEVFRSKWAEKLPGVRPSNRAYTGFLNKLRSDTFANMVDLAKKQGKDPQTDLVLGKQIADFINNATGRGKLGPLEGAAKPLADVFFAPRLMASRVHTYTQVLNPKFYTTLDPSVRKEALKSLFAVAATGGLVGEIAKLGGAQVSNDPTNSDFRKIKIGNTRIDPFGGFQQYPVAAIRLLSGKSTSSTSGRTTDLTAGKFGQQNRATVAENFLTNKLAPLPAFVFSWMKGKQFDGTPFDAKQALLKSTVPIVAQDLKELYDEDPSLFPLGILPILGVGMQTYGR